MSNDIKIIIGGDASGLEAAAKRGTQAVSGMEKSLEGTQRATDALTSSFARMGHTAVAGLGGHEVIQAADAWATLNARLSLVTDGSASAALAYERVVQIAKSTRIGLKEVGSIYEKFARQSAELGLSSEQLTTLTSAVAQAMTISGGSAASAQAALQQFGQALSSGVLRGEELNSVLEQSPRLAQALADGLGVPIGKLRELGQAGELTSDKLIGALTGQAARLSAEFERMPLTVGGALTNIKTQWTDAVGAFGNSTGVFTALAENLDTLVVSGTTLAGLMSGRLIASFAASAQAKIADAQASQQVAASTAAAAVAKQRYIAIQLAETQAAVAAASGMQRLALVQATLVPLQQRYAAATAASAAANVAASVSARAGSAVMGALGGPIGIVTTALTLGAAAWVMWGDKAKSASDQAVAALKEAEEGAAGLNQSTLAYARTRRDQALDLYNEKGMRQGSPERTDYMRWDALVQDLERKERAAAERSARSAATVSEKWSELYANQAEKRSQAVSKLDAAYAKEIVAAKGNQELQLQIAADYPRKLAVINEQFKPAQTEGEKAFKTVADAAARYAVELDAAVVKGEQLTQGEKALADAKERLTAKEFAQIEAVLRGNVVKEQAVEAEKQNAKLVEERQRANERRIDDMAREAESLQEQVLRQRAENEEIGLTVEQLDALRLARIDATIAAKEQALATAESGDASAREIQQLLRQIDALRELRGLTAGGQVAAANQRALDAQKHAWENFARDIEQSLTDALMRSFEAGDNAGEAFVKTLQNTLKAAALKLAVQVVLQPIMGQGGLLQQAAGSLGMAGQGGGSGAGGLVSLGSNLAGGSIGAALGGSLATSFGASSTLGSFGAGMALQAGGGTWAGAGAIGGAAQLGYAMPYIGGALAIASALGLFGGEKAPPEMGLTGYKRGTNEKYDANVDAGKANYVESSFGILRAASQHIDGDGEAALNAKLAEKYLKPIAGLDNLIAGYLDKEVVGRIQDALDNWKPGEGETPAKFNDQLEARLGKITDEIGGFVDEVFDQLDGDLKGRYALTEALLRVEGRTDYEALARDLAGLSDSTAGSAAALLGNLVTVNDVFDRLGQSLLAVTATGADAASQLIDAFGGLDKFAAGTAQYFNLFYTDAEKLAASTQSMADQFADLGVAMPATKDGFRAIVDALDLTTASGQELYASLIGIAPAFDALVQQADAALADAQSAVSGAQADLAQAYRREADTLRNQYQQNLDTLTNAYEREADAKRNLIDQLGDYVDGLKDARKALQVGELSPFSAAQKLTLARADYRSTAEAAAMGDTQALDALPAVAQRFLELSKAQSATAIDYARDFADVSASLENTASLTEAQIGIEQLALDALTTGFEEQKQVLSDAYAAQQGALDAQVGSLISIDSGVQSVVAAINALAAAQTGLSVAAQDKAAADAAALAQVQQQQQDAAITEGAAAAQAAADAAAAAKAAADAAAVDALKGISAQDVDKLAANAIAAIAAAVGAVDTKIKGATKSELQQAISVQLNIQTADLGGLGKADLQQIAQAIGLTTATVKSYDVGTRYVPQDMLANIHQGEIIIDPASAGILRQYGIGLNVGADPELAAEIAALRAELKAALGAVASNTRQSKELLDSVVNGGNTLRTEVVA